MLSWAVLAWGLSCGCSCVLAGLPLSEVLTRLEDLLPRWLTLIVHMLAGYGLGASVLVQVGISIGLLECPHAE